MQLVLGEPPAGLRRPVLLAGFGGWGDAGSAASIALRHVLGDPAPPASAMLDPPPSNTSTAPHPLPPPPPNVTPGPPNNPKLPFNPPPFPEANPDWRVCLAPGPHSACP